MKTILLIEDNDGIRENTAEILELTGYRVLTAENGKVGIEKALETRPDLVICDIMMPVLDGYGVLHIINKNPQLTSIPFIFLTARTERTDFRRGMELGADDYLTKPFDESELLSAIEGRLRRFGQKNEAAPETGSAADNCTALTAGVRQNAALTALTADRKVHAVRRKQFIYTEGDDPTRLYCLKAGHVRQVRTSSDGKELITNLYGPGDFFGYLALLSNRPYPDSTVALTDVELVYIPADEFQHLLQTDQRLIQSVLRLLAGQVDERETQLVGMAYNSLRRRVADALLRLHTTTPDAAPNPMSLSRDELASVVGTATESLIRILSEFRQDGLIQQTGGAIHVLQPDRLRRANW